MRAVHPYDAGAVLGMIGGGVSFFCLGWWGIAISVLFYVGYVLVRWASREDDA